MPGLLYRPDMDEVRARLTSWWNGGDIGRPAMLLECPRAEPAEHIEKLPEPPGWRGPYTSDHVEYHVNTWSRAFSNTAYFGEAVPAARPFHVVNCLALYLGCSAKEVPETVWAEPCIADPAEARFDYDPNNHYWRFTLDLIHALKPAARGKFLLCFTDLIEGLDTLAAMRGNEALLTDLLERPDWVHASLRQITDRYFRYYDVLFDLIRDEVGGSHYWVWAPGRVAKFQCDFSAAISAGMFAEFMVPVLTEMTERVSYSIYHWDGPRAIKHLDKILSIPRINVIQWVPGEGNPPCDSEKWWPIYHRIVDGGKKVFIGVSSTERLKALKTEFGPGLRHFLISMRADSPIHAQELLASASG